MDWSEFDQRGFEMSPRLRLLALAFTSLLTSGCVAARYGGAATAPCVFDLECEDKASADATPIKYVVFEETLWITQSAGDGFQFSRAVNVRLSEHESNELQCLVPVEPATVIKADWLVAVLSAVWPLVVGTGEEYRLSVFCPGYRAATLYPLDFVSYARGERSEEDDEAIEEWDCAALLDWGAPSEIGTVRQTDADVHLQCYRQSDGRLRSRLPLLCVDTETTYEDVFAGHKSLFQVGSGGAASDTSIGLFAFQIERLADTISKGQLNNVDGGTRKIVLDAIRLQHDAIAERETEPFPSVLDGPHQGRFFECFHREDSPCRVVAKWAWGH